MQSTRFPLIYGSAIPTIVGGKWKNLGRISIPDSDNVLWTAQKHEKNFLIPASKLFSIYQGLHKIASILTFSLDKKIEENWMKIKKFQNIRGKL